jgi:hypothetical protein
MSGREQCYFFEPTNADYANAPQRAGSVRRFTCDGALRYLTQRETLQLQSASGTTDYVCELTCRRHPALDGVVARWRVQIGARVFIVVRVSPPTRRETELVTLQLQTAPTRSP